MELGPGRVVGLLVVAIAVAMAARRVRLPYTVGLVVTGICLALAHVPLGLTLTHDFIFDIILPPLLFEASLAIHWRSFAHDSLPILSLAILGVIVSAEVIALGMAHLLGWPAGPAAVFGVLISATDPVAVIAMFKDARIAGRLRLLVESESLLNDGVAAVLFALALAWAQAPAGATADWLQIGRNLLLTVAGGLGTGAACGALAIIAVGRTSDHLVETALTTVAAYGSFLLAERLGASGVLATVAAGALIGNSGLLTQGETEDTRFSGRDFIADFWEFAAFIGNSLLFLLIGGTVGGLGFAVLGWRPLLLAIGLVLAGRAISVYPLCLAFTGSRWAIPLADQHVLWWGGLRGPLALALALALPPGLPRHDQIVLATFGVVAFSVVLQGLTMPGLLRVLRLRGRVSSPAEQPP